MNDILRFWKTLCLNYEHRRNQSVEAKKIKQKIRNFKLGHSRLLTCFATVALLSSYNKIDRNELIRICRVSPVEKFLDLVDRRPEIKELLVSALALYHWFLEKTELPLDKLEGYFASRDNRVVAFRNARNFGDQIYEIVHTTAEKTGTFRHLVV